MRAACTKACISVQPGIDLPPGILRYAPPEIDLPPCHMPFDELHIVASDLDLIEDMHAPPTFNHSFILLWIAQRLLAEAATVFLSISSQEHQHTRTDAPKTDFYYRTLSLQHRCASSLASNPTFISHAHTRLRVKLSLSNSAFRPSNHGWTNRNPSAATATTRTGG